MLCTLVIAFVYDVVYCGVGSMSLNTSVRGLSGMPSLRPSENIIGKYEGCVCTIRVESSGENLKSRGSCFVTNQRVSLDHKANHA